MIETASASASVRIPPVAVVAVSLTMIFWSGTVVANRAALESFDGLTAGAFRSMLAGLLALAIARLCRLPFPKTRRDRTLLVVSGWLNFAIWPVILSVGIALANASHAALIMAPLPVTTGLIAAIANRARPKGGWWLGAAIALAGTLVLIAFTQPTGGLTLSQTYLTGDLLIMAGVILCSAGYVAGANLAPAVGSWSSTCHGLAVALLLLVPVMLVLASQTNWSAVTTDSWLSIGWMALFSSLLGYALWFLAMDRAGIARIAVFQFLQPVLSAIAAALVLGEQITVTIVFSGALILLGIWIAQKHAH